MSERESKPGNRAAIEAWNDAEETPPKLEEMRQAFGDEMFKNDLTALLDPVVGVLVYSLPAFTVLFSIHKQSWFDGTWFTATSIVLVLGGIVIYATSSGRSGDQDELSRAYEVEKWTKDWTQTFPVSSELRSKRRLDEIDPGVLDALLLEYQLIGEEARYRDRLVNRSTYYALAIIAGYGAILVRAADQMIPLIFVLLSFSMYVFAMALLKYKDARDPLWKRQRDMERTIPAFRGVLTTFHTIRTPPRRLLDRFSMSSSLIVLYLSLMAFAVLGYLLSVYALASPTYTLTLGT